MQRKPKPPSHGPNNPPRQARTVHLKLRIEKLRREIFGPRSERSARLLDQMELQLEELEASATEDELKAETAAAKTTNVAGFSRKRASRKPFPEHLPRERVVVPGPTSCLCCGGARLSKLGEDVTETLEVIPRQFRPEPTKRPSGTHETVQNLGVLWDDSGVVTGSAG